MRRFSPKPAGSATLQSAAAGREKNQLSLFSFGSDRKLLRFMEIQDERQMRFVYARYHVTGLFATDLQQSLPNILQELQKCSIYAVGVSVFFILWALTDTFYVVMATVLFGAKRAEFVEYEPEILEIMAEQERKKKK
jgi:hypothetical protein